MYFARPSLTRKYYYYYSIKPNKIIFFLTFVRDAFSGFDAETVANFTDKQMTTISSHYGIEISRVRGVVDNSNRILEVISPFITLFNQFIMLLLFFYGGGVQSSNS